MRIPPPLRLLLFLAIGTPSLSAQNDRDKRNDHDKNGEPGRRGDHDPNAQHDPPVAAVDEELTHLAAAAKNLDPVELEHAIARIEQIALGSDAVRTAAAVELLPRFGSLATTALETIVEQGCVLPVRMRALQLRMALRKPGDAGWFSQVALSTIPTLLRLTALDGIGDDAAALTAVEPLLLAKEPRLQTRALRLLSAAHHPAASSAARLALGADGASAPAVKVAAIDVLRVEQSRDAIHTLVTVAGAECGEVREFAIRSLLVMDRGAVLLELLPLLDPDANHADALVAIEVVSHSPEEAVPDVAAALRATLRHKNPNVRAAALRALGQLGDREALPLIEQAIVDPDMVVAVAAIAAATTLERDVPGWRQRLLQLAHARLPAIQIAAVRALGEIADSATVPFLLKLLADDDWRVREAAVLALTPMRSPLAIEPLIELLGKERKRVRSAIALALRRVSAMPFQDLERDWQRWWADHRDGFEPPPIAAVDTMEKRLAENRAKATTRATFYGIPVDSDRLALIIDVSGSMAALEGTSERSRLDVAKNEVEQMIERLEDGAELNLFFFADTIERWRSRLTKVTRPIASDATAFARNRTAGGATNLFDALVAALGDPEVDTLYVLSDGEPNAGKFFHPAEVRAEILRRNQGNRVRIHTVSIGGPSALLHHLADDSGGEYIER